MSYVISIVRTPNEGEPAKPPITEAEWHQVISMDTSLIVGPDGLTVRWTAHPKAEEVIFSYGAGEIVAMTPDDPTLQKMQEIAKKLDARMRGEEGEFLDDIDYSKLPDASKGYLGCLVFLGLGALAAWLIWKFFF